MSDNKEVKKVGIIGKLISYTVISVPIIAVVAVGWFAFKYIMKKKNGEDASVGETVSEGIAFVKKTVSMFNVR